MNYCNNCGNKLESENNFCPKCGKKCNKTYNDSKDSNSYKVFISFKDFIRYFIGGIIIVYSLSFFDESFLFALMIFLFGFSILPIFYIKIVSKLIKNDKVLTIIQIVVPIILFIISNMIVQYSEESGPVLKQITEEEIVTKKVKDNLYSSYQTINKQKKNNETGKYDFEIKYSKNDLNAYECALYFYNFATNIAGTEKIGNVQFECLNNNEVILYVKVDNVSLLNGGQIEDNINYYDSNYNEIRTDLDKLEKNAIDDYKKSCNTYKYKDVLRNPDDYAYKRAYWYGKIVQVVEKTSTMSEFRIEVNCKKYEFLNEYYCDDAIYVVYYGDKSFIEDDMVKMWGTMKKTVTYTTVLGASITIPKFEAKYMELQ